MAIRRGDIEVNEALNRSTRPGSPKRALKKGMNRLDYVVGCEVSNRVTVLHGEPLLNKTPTTAREIKEAYKEVDAAKKAARLKALENAKG